ncbi:MAG: enoyl-CoA hydratase/isomerase family protein, partial [Planctomycetes bacterium]|nr:enoyl-CoA hydratase/isomerase family protein [Planctomycetota bacterium]
MSDTDIQLNVDGTVATIAIVTDGGLNVGSSGMMRKFSEVVAQVAENRQVRATVIRGEGKVFLAGADIKEMATFDREKALEYGRLGQSVLNAIESLPSITVAAINGAAMGGGMELALACDFRIAVKSAKIGLPESSLGLIPGWGGIIRATRLIGPSRAKKLAKLSALTASDTFGAIAAEYVEKLRREGRSDATINKIE